MFIFLLLVNVGTVLVFINIELYLHTYEDLKILVTVRYLGELLESIPYHLEYLHQYL